MGFIIKKAKENEVHTDTIRVFEDRRKTPLGCEIKSGSLCKVKDETTGKHVYAILRGIETEEENEKGDIKIDESLRKVLSIDLKKGLKIEHEFTFHKICFLEELYWMCTTTDYGYRISSQIAIISLILGILSIFSPLLKLVLSLFSNNIFIHISPEKLSSIISILVALVILFASFFQWWNITYNGGMLTRTWVKFIFAFCIAFLLISLFLII